MDAWLGLSVSQYAVLELLARLSNAELPIARMRQYAHLRAQGDSTTAARLALLEDHQRELRAQLARLQAHEQALATKIATYQDALAAGAGPHEGARA